MDTIGKVEAAITSFREKKRKDASRLAAEEEQQKRDTAKRGNARSGSSDLNSPILLGKVAGKEKNDCYELGTMEEFDQYVLYSDMKKRAEPVQEGSSRNQLCIRTDVGGSVNSVHLPTSLIVSKGLALEQDVTSDGTDSVEGQADKDQSECEKLIDAEEQIEQEDELSEEISETGCDLVNAEEYLFPTPEEVHDAKAPEVGMVFPSLEEAVKFVNVYGKVTGFAVIKGRNYKGRKITLQCNKSRRPRAKSSVERKRKRTLLDKTNCQMNVTVKLIESKWQIISCFLEHNHELASSPSLTKFFLSHRTMTEDEIMLSKLLQEIRVKPQKIMTVFRRLKGSYGSIMFGKKRVNNLKQAEKRSKKNSDIACALKYIEKIQLTKPGFCAKMEVDGEGAVRSIFWTDARSRLDYKLFGEIICFDTTYSTNKYNMPFAPIIGINGHAKTIVFGWALLKDQKAVTFEWLFKSFVEIMEGKRPKLILTDQDAAIALAVKNFFPGVFHRFCIWHILQNLKENMSAYMSEREGMERKIISLIMESLEVEEFESGWNEMITTYNCADHDHIKRMWNVRDMFVPAYFKGRFCPFTRSTGRSESFNSTFKEYIMRKDTIENFLKQYELFQEHIMEAENADRFESTQKIPAYWCRQPIERHAAKIYTRGIYMKFATEMLNSTAFGVKETVKDTEYELKKLFNYEKPEYMRESFTVFANRNNLTFQCNCGKFEKDGLLCCHILRLFTQWDIVEIPAQYILPRWTVEFRESELLKQKQDSIEVHGNNTSESALRFAMLMNSMNDVCADLSRDAAKSKVFIEEVQKLHKRLMTENVPQNSNQLVLQDPPVIRKKLSKPTDQDVELESATRTDSNSVDIWVNVDGSISKPVENKKEKVKSTNQRKKQPVAQDSAIKDPPVSNSKSVNKGDRLKPQSEKRSRKKKG